jgi:hypothetical protein
MSGWSNIDSKGEFSKSLVATLSFRFRTLYTEFFARELAPLFWFSSSRHVNFIHYVEAKRGICTST